MSAKRVVQMAQYQPKVCVVALQATRQLVKILCFVYNEVNVEMDVQSPRTIMHVKSVPLLVSNSR